MRGSLSRRPICPSAPPRFHRLLEAARWNRAALVGRMKSLRAAVLVGIGFSAAVGALALAVLSPGWASTTYLWPGIQTAELLVHITPTAVVYWLVPGGGAPAYLLHVLTGAFVSWAVLFALAAFAIRRDARALLTRRSQAPRMRQ